jgi:hypothetical protein
MTYEMREHYETDDRRRDIDTMCEILRLVWLDYPDMRLMQLLGNILGADDHYHRTDGDVFRGLMAYPDEADDVRRSDAVPRMRDELSRARAKLRIVRERAIEQGVWIEEVE